MSPFLVSVFFFRSYFGGICSHHWWYFPSFLGTTLNYIPTLPEKRSPTFHSYCSLRAVDSIPHLPWFLWCGHIPRFFTFESQLVVEKISSDLLLTVKYLVMDLYRLKILGQKLLTHSHFYGLIYKWLLGGIPTPLKNMSLSIGMIIAKIYTWKMKNVPKHQPNEIW